MNNNDRLIGGILDFLHGTIKVKAHSASTSAILPNPMVCCAGCSQCCCGQNMHLRPTERTMKNNDGLVGGILDVLHETIKVQAHSLGVKVAVELPFHAGIGEDALVVAPGWVGEVHRLARNALVDELGANPQRSCARE